MKSNPSSQKRILGIVFFTIFLDLLGFGIIIPIQPFFAELLGASPAVVTLLGASFSLMQFLFAPFWGKLSDRIGRRPVMLASIFISALGYAIFGFAKSLEVLFFARMLAGFGSANIGTAQAIISDTTTSETRAKGMGLIGAAFGLGFIFGPAIGGLFGQLGLWAPAYVASGLCFMNLISTYLLLPETHVRGQHPQDVHRATGFQWRMIQLAIRRQNIAQLFLLCLMFTVAFSLMEQVLGLLIQATWLNSGGVAIASESHARQAAALTAYVLIVVGVTATIIQGGLIGRLAKKFGERRLVMVGTLFVGGSLLLIPFVAMTGIFALLLVVCAFMAIGTGVTNPSLMSLLSQSAGIEDRGSTLGLGQSFSALGRVLGPAVAGTLFQFSHGLPFWVGAGLMFVCTLIAVSLRPPKHFDAPSSVAS